MPQQAFVGIDLGTSGVRACAINQAGQVLAEARRELPASRVPQSGWAEQQARDWWQACLQLLDELFARPELEIRALSVDGTSGSLLLCHTDGEPLGPALMYNDARATAQAALIGTFAPPQAAVHSASSALAKLMWLQNQGMPEGARPLHQADWIAGKLLGRFENSDENNALKLGYDPLERRWPAWMQDSGIDTQILPRVLPVGSVLGEIAPSLAQRWRCAHPVQVLAGTTDSNAATLASGIDRIADASTALGSTLVLKVLADRPVSAPQFGVYSHRLGEQLWLVGGASNTGGAVLRRYFNDADIAALSARIDPCEDSGLDYYPLLSPGERFPINDPMLQARLSPDPGDKTRFLHGLLEGIARIELQGYKLLESLGAPYPARVLSTGGGALNQTWSRMRERLLGVPVCAAHQTQAAYGSARIAAGLKPA